VLDNFFDLGGHSLLLGRVQATLQRMLGRRVPITALFEHPTIRALALYLDGAPEAGSRRVESGSPRPARGRLRRRAASVGPAKPSEGDEPQA
jgi:hypothetical protein